MQKKGLDGNVINSHLLSTSCRRNKPGSHWSVIHTLLCVFSLFSEETTLWHMLSLRPTHFFTVLLYHVVWIFLNSFWIVLDLAYSSETFFTAHTWQCLITPRCVAINDSLYLLRETQSLGLWFICFLVESQGLFPVSSVTKNAVIAIITRVSLYMYKRASSSMPKKRIAGSWIMCVFCFANGDDWASDTSTCGVGGVLLPHTLT